MSIKDDNKEVFGIPDITKTLDTKATSYDRLTPQGYVPVGTVVNKGDIIIGKYAPLPEGFDKQYQFQDMSMKWSHEETGIVSNVVVGAFEDGKKFIKIGFRKLRSVQLGDKFCLTPDHEVLTDDGWKLIQDVKTYDGVATLNPHNNQIEYQSPDNTYEFDHDGQMISIKGREIDTCMTLNHKVYARIGKGPYQLYEAKDITNIKTNWQRWGINTNPDIKTFTVPNTKQTYNMDDWLAFLGLWLTEGCVDKSHQIRISAHKDRVSKLLQITAANLGLVVKYYGGIDPNTAYITNKEIATYLMAFGHSIDKYLPNYVFELSSRQSLILLNALLTGDGCYYNNCSWEFYTGSKQLADDFQRLSIQCNLSSKMSLKKAKGEQLSIKGVQTTRMSDQYRISVIQNENNLEPSVGGASNPIKFVDYKGKVYCLEVDNHIFLVRKNGLMYWTGNSARSGLKNSGRSQVIE